MNIYNNNSQVGLYNVPLSDDNQIKFSTKNEQECYFQKHRKTLFKNLSYSFVENNVILIDRPKDLINDINYCSIKNKTKTYYFYVTKIVFNSDNSSFLYLKMDVFQTYFLDIELKKSYIERITPLEDYYNVMPDVVNTGKMVKSYMKEISLGGCYLVICSSDVTVDDCGSSSPKSFTIDSYTLPTFTIVYSNSEREKMSSTIQNINNKGRGDRILSCVFIPLLNKKTIECDTINSDVGLLHVCRNLSSNNLRREIMINFPQSDYLKMCTFPYTKIVVEDTGSGQSIELCPEKFENQEIKFEVIVTISEMPTMKIIPKNYCGENLNHKNCLAIKLNTSLPILNNQYAKYMMSNSQSLNYQKNMGLINAGISALSGNVIGGVTSLYSTISSINIQQGQAEKSGNQITNIIDDAMSRLVFYNDIRIIVMQPDEYYQESIKSYWKMFGYPVNKLSHIIINPTTSQYIKTSNLNIMGDIPYEHKEELENLFKKGITFWKEENFLEY